MADDFIPLNQSTPVQRQWNSYRPHYRGGKRTQFGVSGMRNASYSSDNNSYGNNSHSNNSYSNNSSCNNSYSSNSYSNNRSAIDAYLHPSMLQDPWAQLRKRMK